ncbi:hypothetical protein GmHk_20G058241 [Glycine max]|nr:hypothetical protein GmHk_20G058241 [Glycine max]
MKPIQERNFKAILGPWELGLLSGVEARPLEVRKLDSTTLRMWAMLHSGPSPGGKGHKSETEDAPIPRELKQSVPSPGVGH